MTREGDHDGRQRIRRNCNCAPDYVRGWKPNGSRQNSYQHWTDLHRAANELRDAVTHARAGVEAIDQDKDLTPDARKRKKHELARQTMTQLEKIPSVEKARASVASIQSRWQAKIDGVLTKPTADDAATATLFWEVRDKFAQLADERAAWLGYSALAMIR